MRDLPVMSFRYMSLYSLTDMKLLETLEDRGWARVPGITGPADLLGLATSLGKPVENARHALISELRVAAGAEARPMTLSATFGTGAFPLHTDTAFWPTPAKFLVMLAEGDLRRTTTVCSLRSVLDSGGITLMNLIEKSIWIVRGKSGNHYGQMTLSTKGFRSGVRFDRQCMKPANASAREVAAYFDTHDCATTVEHLEWRPQTAVVISNWHALHGRGSRPANEQQRILQRIYVE
jgi:hypothetical protein